MYNFKVYNYDKKQKNLLYTGYTDIIDSFLIHPFMYKYLEEYLGHDKLIDIIYFNEELVEDPEYDMYTGIGMMGFKDNFELILDYYKDDSKKDLLNFIMKIYKEDALFFKSVPIINVTGLESKIDDVENIGTLNSNVLYFITDFNVFYDIYRSGDSDIGELENALYHLQHNILLRDNLLSKVENIDIVERLYTYM